MGQFARAGAQIGQSLGEAYQAYEAGEKKKKKKQSTLDFIDQLLEDLGEEETAESPQGLLGEEETGEPTFGSAEEAEEYYLEGTEADFDMFDLETFPEELEEGYIDLESPVGAAGIPSKPVGTPGTKLTDEQDRRNLARQRLQMYKGLYEQEGDVSGESLDILENIGNIMTPSKQRGLSFEQKKELEDIKSTGKSEFEEEKAGYKQELETQKQANKMEQLERKYELALTKSLQIIQDKENVKKFDDEGLSILRKVDAGDQTPESGLKQIEYSIAEIDADMKSRRDELSEYVAPELAKASRVALTDLEKTKKNLMSYRRRIQAKGGMTDKAINKLAEKTELSRKISILKNALEKADEEKKSSIEKAIAVAEKKLSELE